MIIPYWFQTPSSKDGVLIIHDQNAHAKDGAKLEKCRCC